MNGVEMVGRMMLALGVVVALMWALAKWSKRTKIGKSGEVLDILARQQISRTASVAVIKIADRAIVVGVTEQSVQMLTETDLSQIEEALVVDEPAGDRIRGGRRVFADHLAELTEGDPEDDRSTSETPAAGSLHTVTRSASRSSSRNRSTGRRRPAAASPRGGFDGSILSPKMWRQLVDGARDLTVRK